MRTTIEMAREAAGDDWGLFQEYMPEIHRLAELVRADEKAQRTWVGLTDEEIQTTWNSVMDGAVFTRREIYKAIEAKLKEKNT
jgi:hypothetical protein